MSLASSPLDSLIPNAIGSVGTDNTRHGPPSNMISFGPNSVLPSASTILTGPSPTAPPTDRQLFGRKKYVPVDVFAKPTAVPSYPGPASRSAHCAWPTTRPPAGNGVEARTRRSNRCRGSPASASANTRTLGAVDESCADDGDAVTTETSNTDTTSATDPALRLGPCLTTRPPKTHRTSAASGCKEFLDHGAFAPNGAAHVHPHACVPGLARIDRCRRNVRPSRHRHHSTRPHRARCHGWRTLRGRFGPPDRTVHDLDSRGSQQLWLIREVSVQRGDPHASAVGHERRVANHVYFAALRCSSSPSGAPNSSIRSEVDLGRERIYIVETTGPFDEDPNFKSVSTRGFPPTSPAPLGPAARCGSSARGRAGRVTRPRSCGACSTASTAPSRRTRRHRGLTTKHRPTARGETSSDASVADHRPDRRDLR